MPGARDDVPHREPVVEFDRIGVTAFTTTRAAGDFALRAADAPDGNEARWLSLVESLAPRCLGLVSSVQVHGADIAEQSEPWAGWKRLDGVDAHVVSAEGSAAVTVADCVPVFVAHESGVVALAHAGWRGVAGNIVALVIGRMNSASLPSSEMHVHLGPAICGRCYEVGPDVYERLTGWQTTRNRHVDLRALIAEQARTAGVRNVSSSVWCTRCDSDRFFTHRGGDVGRQVGVIVSSAGQAARTLA
ncbi:MAG: polyphenol oxidase family protein [Gemmatimonadetes bacterium]|nr:polyphenol oxidase family protein [Gemmatimonadota bacterium]